MDMREKDIASNSSAKPYTEQDIQIKEVIVRKLSSIWRTKHNIKKPELTTKT